MIETVTTSLKRVVRTRITDGPHTSPQLVDDGIPFISAEGIVDGKIYFTKKRGFIKRKDHNVFAQKLLPQFGDIFFVKSGSTTGKIAIVETKEEFNVWSPLALIRVNDLVDNRLLYYILQSPSFQLQVRQYWSFGTQPNIGMNKIEQLKVTFPKSKAIQQKIVKYLDELFEKTNRFIQSKQRFIEFLKEQRQSIIDEALEIEAKKIRLKFCVSKVGSGVTPKGGASVYQNSGVTFLRSQNIHNESLRLDDVAFITDKIHAEMSSSQVRRGDVVLNITGASIGRCYWFNSDEEANVNQHVSIIRPDFEILDSEFLMYQIQSQRIQHLINTVQGASREGLTIHEIKNYQLLVPSTIEEQKRIVEHIKTETRTLDITVSKAEREIELIKEYREAMIAEAVTGKMKF